jgi:hypothetical protein
VTTPGTELDAADRGLGSLGLTFGQFAEQEKRIAEYRRRIRNCEPVGAFVNDQVSTVNFLYLPRGRRDGPRQPGRRMATRSTTSPPSSSPPREAFPAAPISPRPAPQLRRQATGPDAHEQAGEGLRLRSARSGVVQRAQALGGGRRRSA